MFKALLSVLIHACFVSSIGHALLFFRGSLHHGIKECESSASEQPEICLLYSFQITENCCGFSTGSEQQFVLYMSLDI